MSKKYANLIIGAIVVAAIWLNAAPITTRSSITCSDSENKFQQSVSQTYWGVPVPFYVKSAGDGSGKCDLYGMHLTSGTYKRQGFYFQALVIDVAILGAVLTGAYFLLNPPTKGRRA
jgi:hypothetical protein